MPFALTEYLDLDEDDSDDVALDVNNTKIFTCPIEYTNPFYADQNLHKKCVANNHVLQSYMSRYCNVERGVNDQAILGIKVK